MFWGGEGGLWPRTWAAPRAGPDPSEGKVVERLSIRLSVCLGLCLYLGGTMSSLCLHLEPEADPRLARRGRWTGRSPGWGQSGRDRSISPQILEQTGQERWAWTFLPALSACHGTASTQHVGDPAWTHPISCSLSLSRPTCMPSLLLLHRPLLPEQPRWLPTGCFKSALCQGK